MRYPKEKKEAILKNMMPPNNQTIADLAQDEGISEGTLYNWRIKIF
ncbi:MAG: transposase [Thermodesulfobacteriota bacterium]|nr:transposase [Thermodesulfobacteriota bacterium]